MRRKYIEKYCTGCGLCKALGENELENDSKGFSYPLSYDYSFLSSVCPSAGNQIDVMDKAQVWGKCEKVYKAWSNDSRIRKLASSGGILTEIAEYLLREKIVDGIIQTKSNCKKPWETTTIISRTIEDVEKCIGSRYSISHPLEIISELNPNESYAIIARPCDIISIRNYLDRNKNSSICIKYYFAFFCAGMPSKNAQDMLLKEMKCNPEDCKRLNYRGNGWPGYTTATDSRGNTYEMTYSESWGRILGRDIMSYCRVCLDGIGEMADISCGDAWYIGDDGYPDFSEHDGRNVVFCRTDIGLSLFEKMVEEKIVCAEYYEDFEKELATIQYAQRERRETMLPKILALKLLFRSTPQYPLSFLYGYFKGSSMKRSIQVFKGTLKRALLGKL